MPTTCNWTQQALGQVPSVELWLDLGLCQDLMMGLCCSNDRQMMIRISFYLARGSINAHGQMMSWWDVQNDADEETPMRCWMLVLMFMRCSNDDWWWSLGVMSNLLLGVVDPGCSSRGMGSWAERTPGPTLGRQCNQPVMSNSICNGEWTNFIDDKVEEMLHDIHRWFKKQLWWSWMKMVSQFHV